MPRNRGKKAKSRNASKLPPTKEEAEALEKAFREAGGPIALAILGAVMVEYELDSCLRPRLHRNDDSSWLMLVEDNGPLGTFHQKILAGYALGLYDDRTRKNLNIVKHIRNRFAHSQRVIDFSHEDISELMDGVGISKQHQKYFSRVRKEKNGNQLAYGELCYWISTRFIRRKLLRLKSQKIRLKKSKLNPYSEPLLKLLRAGSISNASLSSPATQTADPKSLTPFQGLFGLGALSGPPGLLHGTKRGDSEDK